MSMEVKKRGANFSKSEVDTLINIIYIYKDIVENKKADATTWKKKNEVWEKITSQFNATSGNYPRNSKTIRSKYDSIKELRKKCATMKADAMKTGGGISEYTTLLPHEEKILSVTQLSMIGLPSRFDSDEIENPDVFVDPGEGTSQRTICETIEYSIEPIITAVTLEDEASEDKERNNNEEVIQPTHHTVKDKKKVKQRQSLRKNPVRFPEVIQAKLEVLELQKELLLEERRMKAEINKIMLEKLEIEKKSIEIELEIKKIQLSKMQSLGKEV